MQQSVAPRSGLDSPEDSEGWVPVAREHYNTSLIPWVGRKGEKWLTARMKPSNDPRLVLVTTEVYNLWKAHAIGSGGPFPTGLLKNVAPPATDADADPDTQMTAGGRATLLLGALAIVAFLIIAGLLLLRG
jgi:hypothetical protein